MAETNKNFAFESIEIDKPGEECGVFGIYAPGQPVAELAYLGLQALQHRGQDGAGISVSDGESTRIYSALGKIQQVFLGGGVLGGVLGGLLEPSKRILAIGHTRYDTSDTPSDLAEQALQPALFTKSGHENVTFTFSTNGHMSGLKKLALEYGINSANTPSDSILAKEIFGEAFIRNGSLHKALLEVLPRVQGAQSSIFSTPDSMIATRDPQGFRPLHLGRLGNAGWVVASEIAALDIVGAHPVREINPGEMLTITGPGEEGLHSEQFAEPKPALCGFEFVYFSRPDNIMHGELVVEVRERMGRLLAEGDDVEADMVLGVPESGLSAADGYSEARGIPHKRRLIKNNYVDRSFIAPTQDIREQSVRNKLNPITTAIEGQSVIVVDDSIVRGTTQRELIKMLRNAGAKEVHVRISSPPYKSPCFYGMDTGREEELLARNLSVDEIRDYIGADSLRFLTDEQMQIAVGMAAGKICTACTTGIYPTKVPGEPIPLQLTTRQYALATT